MKTVLVSGHFDPFHYAHLIYIKHAATLGDLIYCVVSADEHLIEKKGFVNQHEFERAIIVDSVLAGVNIPHIIYVNHWDKTNQVAGALRALRPHIFCRGNDKNPEDFPETESEACKEFEIEVVYAPSGYFKHGQSFKTSEVL